MEPIETEEGTIWLCDVGEYEGDFPDTCEPWNDRPILSLSVTSDGRINLWFGEACVHGEKTKEIDVITLTDVEGETLLDGLTGALGICETMLNPVNDEARQKRLIDLLADGTRRQCTGESISPARVVEIAGLIAADIVEDGGSPVEQFRLAGLI